MYIAKAAKTLRMERAVKQSLVLRYVHPPLVFIAQNSWQCDKVVRN